MEYFLQYWLPVIPSLVAFMSLLYTAKHQNKIDEKNNDREERKQASLVSTWNLRGGGQTVSNRSSVPVFNLSVFMCYNQEKLELDQLLENVKDSPVYTGDFHETFPPGETKINLFDNKSMGNQHSLPAIIFTDSQNNQWYRHANGYLEKIQNYDYLDRLQKLGLILGHI